MAAALSGSTLATQTHYALTLVGEVLDVSYAQVREFAPRLPRFLDRTGTIPFFALLTLLSSRYGAALDQRDIVSEVSVVNAAAVVELTHLAAACHDHTEAGAGATSATSATTGATGEAIDCNTAILVGDLIFADAARLVAGLGADYVRIQAEAFAELTTARLLDDGARSGNEGLAVGAVRMGCLATAVPAEVTASLAKLAGALTSGRVASGHDAHDAQGARDAQDDRDPHDGRHPPDDRMAAGPAPSKSTPPSRPAAPAGLPAGPVTDLLATLAAGRTPARHGSIYAWAE